MAKFVLLAFLLGIRTQEPEWVLEIMQAHFADGETEAHEGARAPSGIHHTPTTRPGQKPGRTSLCFLSLTVLAFMHSCPEAWLPCLQGGTPPPADPGNTSLPRLARPAAPGQGWTGLIWGHPGT